MKLSTSVSFIYGAFPLERGTLREAAEIIVPFLCCFLAANLIAFRVQRQQLGRAWLAVSAGLLLPIGPYAFYCVRPATTVGFIIESAVSGIATLSTFKLADILFSSNPKGVRDSWYSFLCYHGLLATPVYDELAKRLAVPTRDTWRRAAIDFLRSTAFLAILLGVGDEWDWELSDDALTNNLFKGVVVLSIVEQGFAVSALASCALGFVPTKAFDNPLLSTSVRSFWAQRYNLAVHSLLKRTWALPVARSRALAKKPTLRRVCASAAAFLGSGLLHEIVNPHLSQKRILGRPTAFFLLQFAFTTCEALLGRSTRFRLPTVVSWALTVMLLGVGADLFVDDILPGLQVAARAYPVLKLFSREGKGAYGLDDFEEPPVC